MIMAEPIKAQLLIVDDEASVRLALELALERPAWAIRSVGSAEQALPLLRTQKFDLLLLDKNLPGMSGVELLRQLRTENNGVWAVMITGYPSSSSATETLNLGVKAYLEKPFDDIFKIGERLERLLTLKAAHDRLVRTTEQMRSTTQRLGGRVKALVIAPPGPERDWIAHALSVRHTSTPALVATVQQAKATFRGAPAELVIVDGAMLGPELFGFLGQLESASGNVRAVAVTSQRLSTRTLAMMIDLGLTAVIERPLNEELFRAKIDQALLVRGAET